MSLTTRWFAKIPESQVNFSYDLNVLGKKVKAGTASVASGDTISTGLSSIDAIVVTPQESTSGTAYFVKITSISGGDVTVEIDSYDGSTYTANISTAITVHWIAIGE